MKITACLAVLATAAPLHADDWVWVPVRDGSTLDAHLARDNLARPNPLPIFDILAALTDMADPVAATRHEEM